MLICGVALSLAACDKQPAGEPNGGNNISAVDYVIVSNGMTATADDAALAADETSGIARANVQLAGICGASIADTGNGQVITITYDSTTFCGGVMRSGGITITLNDSAGWRAKNGMITVNLLALQLTDPVTSEQFTLNGTFTVTNESGGLLSGLSNGAGPIIRRHQSLATVAVTFMGTTTNWSFDRTRSWSNLTVGTSKLLNVSQYTESLTGVECSGTNRYSQSFTNTIDTTLQTDTYVCPGASAALMEPYKGMISQTINGLTATIGYGYNEGGVYVGNYQSCPSALTYGYFITFVYTTTNQTGYVFWPYYL